MTMAIKSPAFYFDPYSRPENKSGGAWMDSCIDRGVVGNEIILPVAHPCVQHSTGW